MLPPVLELYVVWHPEDDLGADIARQLVDHFHGTAYTGLIGGAVEVYVRSAGWQDPQDAPRPIPFPGRPWANGLEPARYVAVVPVLRKKMQRAVQFGDTPWRRYVAGLVEAHRRDPEHVEIFPIAVDPGVRGRLDELMGDFQRVDTVEQGGGDGERRCTDLAQMLAQKLDGVTERIRVFISHSRQRAEDDEEGPGPLTEEVRSVLRTTHLDEFFDAVALQPGRKWKEELRRNAAEGAMLVLRSDRYSSRPWCQEEMRTAKYAGLPIVVIDDLHRGEERGSYLLDHVPRVPAHLGGDDRSAAIRRALSILVDECLKRALWRRQQEAAADDTDLDVAWWAAHAPEPITLLHWMAEHADRCAGRPLILHPDPPLGDPELSVLEQLAKAAGIEDGIEVLTPRGLATRGG